MDLMSTNAKGKHIRRQHLLLYGICVENEHPDELKNYDGYTKLSFCPEKEHINMAFYKLAAMMSVAESLTVITVDGSPHCVQLHYIAEELKKYSKNDFEVRHFVIFGGKVEEISSEAVKVSRYLHKISKLMKKTCEDKK